MSTITRREFLAGTAAMGAAAFAGPFVWAAEDGSKITSGADIVTLGRSGVKSSVLGLGTGTHAGRDQRALKHDGFAKLVRHAYERGIRYIDTADMYKTHDLVRHALADLPREEFFIQTKTRAKDPDATKAADAAKADIERFLKELDTDYIDSLLMHCMTTKNWPDERQAVMEVLQEAKAKGQVRAVGVSCHGLEPVTASADCDWVDIHLVRINPFEIKMGGSPEDISAQIKKMHAKKHGVIGMKVFGESGFETPAQRRESLEYVLNLGAVHAFTIGFTSTEQLDETLGMIEAIRA